MTKLTIAAATVLVAAVLRAPAASSQRQPDPIIDMHMHALAADEQGPPPLGMCTPFPEYTAWDPKAPYPDLFLSKFKKPVCADPIWSPMTDAELMNQTIAIAERRNIVGVLSGPAAHVDAWIKARPERFIPALSFQVGQPETPTVAVLRARHGAGKLKVLGEVTNQY